METIDCPSFIAFSYPYIEEIILSFSLFTDAPGANVTQDAGILVLTILVSSILIYNSQNVPYKKDLEKLEYA
jgi:hypothetical protein